jgi:hypothetical protein
LATVHLEDCIDPDRGHSDFLTEYDGGKLDGFGSVQLVVLGSVQPAANYAYGIVEHSEIAPCLRSIIRLQICYTVPNDQNPLR